MGPEAIFYARVRKHLPGKVCRVENSVNSGFPDIVCFLDGGVTLYLELKSMPNKYPMSLRHLTGIQWALSRECRRMGHKYWFLLGVSDVLHVIDPKRLDRFPVMFFNKGELDDATKASFPIPEIGQNHNEFLRAICC